MKIIINGTEHNVEQGCSVAQMLTQLGLDGQPCAVERNRDLVPRAQHRDQMLEAGDVIEIVTLVGGG